MKPVNVTCLWCKQPFIFIQRSKPGRRPGFCSEEHRKLRAAALEKQRYKPNTRKRKAVVTLRSIDEMRRTGLTNDERALLKQRRSDIQIPKEFLERKLKLFKE